MPASYNSYYNFDSDKDSLTFALEEPIERGDDGKPLEPSLTLTQKKLLLGIAAHAKGLKLQIESHNISLRPYGWIELHDSRLQHEVIALSEYLRSYNKPYLELDQSRYVRLSLAPHLIFFSATWFHYSLQEQDKNTWLWRLQRQELPTTLGTISRGSTHKKINRPLALAIKQAVATDEFYAVDDENLPKQIRSALKDYYQKLGLKRFLLIQDKCYKLACNYIDNGSN
ncbi:hypothetical protein TI05_13905 [Achromatium sp. WMS3]|nr:hypothetical protein TI05_13905 [Achromatium sp. WMS3]